MDHHHVTMSTTSLGRERVNSGLKALYIRRFFFSGKVASVVAEVGFLFPRLRASICKSGRQKVHRTVERARFHIKIQKSWRGQSTFGRRGWQKVHETVARARFHRKIAKNCQRGHGLACARACRPRVRTRMLVSRVHTQYLHAYIFSRRSTKMTSRRLPTGIVPGPFWGSPVHAVACLGACSVGERWCGTGGVWQRWCVTKRWWKMVWDRCCVWQRCVCVCERWCERWCVTKMVCYKVLVKDGVRKMLCDKNVSVTKMLCERWCVTKCWWKMVWEERRRGGGGGGGQHGRCRSKNKNPTQFCGKKSKVWMKGFLPSQWYVPVSTLLPVSKVFSFPLLKGPGFPTVFLENFPIFEGFLRAKCFPTVSARAQGCKKIKIKYNKIKSRRQTHTPGKNTGDRTLQICIKHAMCFSQWYVPVLFFLFLFYFFLPGGPGEEPLEFLPPEVP